MLLPDFNGNAHHWGAAGERGDPWPCPRSFIRFTGTLYYGTAIDIGLNTRRIVDAFNRHGYGINALHLTGRHAGSPLLVRLYADATNCHVLPPEGEDSVLLGAAISASLPPDCMARCPTRRWRCDGVAPTPNPTRRRARCSRTPASCGCRTTGLSVASLKVAAGPETDQHCLKA
jgi:sugar (pentulose or hexulose) kinase